MELTAVIFFVGMLLLNFIALYLMIPYAILAGAYIIGVAIQDNKKH